MLQGKTKNKKNYVQSFIILTFIRLNMKRFQRTFPIFTTIPDFQCFQQQRFSSGMFCFHVCQTKPWTSLSSKSTLHIRFFPYLLVEPSGVHTRFPLTGILPTYIFVSAIGIMKSSQILVWKFLYRRFFHVCERMWW